MTYESNSQQSGEPHPEDIIADIEDDIETNNGDVRDYLAWLHKEYGSYNMTETADFMAEIIRPRDQSTLEPMDEGQVEYTFLAGSLIGMKVAHKLLGIDFDNRMSKQLEITSYDEDQDDDETEYTDETEKSIALLNAFVENMVAACEEGLARADAYEQLIEDLEEKLCSDVKWAIYIRRGFGFIMYHAYKVLDDERDRIRAIRRAIRRAEIEKKVAELLPSNEEFDERLQELIESQS